MTFNINATLEEPQWNSKPAWKLPGWAEPMIVATILFGAMFMTRWKGYRISANRSPLLYSCLDDPESTLAQDILSYDSDSEDEREKATSRVNNRNCFGHVIQTPSSSQFKNTVHSRILQKFPFLIEMFYWIINYAFYRMTSIISQRIFSETGIWNVAQSHGLAVLETESSSPLSFLFPLAERDVQRWFMHGHQGALTVLNKAYALIHIPGTVGFICWYYYVAPSHGTFAVARRTMTLTNFFAFLTFIFYPCMPPRLLPKEYGFLDTVRHDDAQSVWMSGKYVNTLAAMPSMHFGYAFCIGCTLIYHSGAFRRTLELGERRKPTWEKIFYLLFGVVYPTFILTTIVATANHYFLDAMVATGFALLSYMLNKVFYIFLPLEDWLLWLIRAKKPIPSTGQHLRGRNSSM